MDPLRALIVGLVLFAVSLLVNGITGRLTGANLATTMPADLPPATWTAALVTAAIGGIAGALVYFLPPQIAATPAAGAALGLFWALLGIPMDAAFILPLRNGRSLLAGYLMHPMYWAGLGTLFLAGVLGGIVGGAMGL
jgi:hypothetical protein